VDKDKAKAIDKAAKDLAEGAKRLAEVPGVAEKVGMSKAQLVGIIAAAAALVSAIVAYFA
jgi:hypothetical protein